MPINQTIQKRFLGIDAGKFVAALGVILIHTANGDHFRATAPTDEVLAFYVDVGRFLGQMSRFAVPFFFIAAGYFLRSKLDKPFNIIVFNLVKRMIPIYFIWSLFYVLIISKRMIWLSDPIHWLEWLVNGGPGFQLWFLPALTLNIILVSYLKPRYTWRILIISAALIYCLGLIMGSYLPLFYPSPDPIWILVMRDSPCFGFMFVLSGLYFAENGAPNLKASWLLFICGGILQLLEAVYLDINHFIAFNTTNTLVGTLPFSIGAFGLALNVNSHAQWVKICAILGRISLGIYAVHVFFVWVADRIASPINISQRLLVSCFVIICSILTAYVLSRIKYTRFLVQ